MKAAIARIHPARESVDADGNRLDVQFEIDGRRFDVFVASRDCRLRSQPEALVALALLPAMRSACECIQVDADLDADFLEGIGKIQARFSDWWPRLSVVKVKPSRVGRTPASTSGSRVGSFFSLGLDSGYTLCRRREEISDLIYVHGFDLSMAETVMRDRVSQAVRRVARCCGKAPIEIETNMRFFLDRFVPWPQAHGAALAAVALLLPDDFQQVYISATHTAAHLIPWGSHPETDPLWSLSGRQLSHYGTDVLRADKAAAILDNDAVRNHLRVCWEGTARAGDCLNCGTCEKCLRTMIDLCVAGGRPPFPTFARQLDSGRVARLVLPGANERVFLEESLQRLKQNGADLELTRAIQTALSDRGLVKKLRLQCARLSPHCRAVRARLQYFLHG